MSVFSLDSDSDKDERRGSTVNEAGMYMDLVNAPRYQMQNELVL